MAQQCDYLVIGSGVAGMWFALRAAKHGQVIMVTKRKPEQSNSVHAQGGIATVWRDDDSFENHIRDTLVAGAGICRREAVEQTVRLGRLRVEELIEMGADFTKSEGNEEEYSLHREGGHSHRRILHAADHTGAEIVRALYARCVATDNIEILEHHMAVNLITEGWVARRQQAIPREKDIVLGAYILDVKAERVKTISAKVTVLATGGAGKVYKFTTNPAVATGDGMAMAWRVGARMANMEFVQFHPTCLYHHELTSFLVSEALRGEGGKLILPDGHRFMPAYDDREELAPRDIVARAIDAEIKKKGLNCVYLDMRHLDREAVERKFPTIHSRLMSVGIDMVTQPIPVVPAAHYMCGGVVTGLSGESSLHNLFAVGEVACTGLHGANRLASNSLLEACVFAEEAAKVAVERAALPGLDIVLPEWDTKSAANSDEAVVITQTWEEIRTFMWNYVGIVRTHRRLKRAQRRIRVVKDEIHTYYWDFQLTADLVELRNLCTIADMIVKCALQRRESRGLHYITDFPDTDDRCIGDTIIQRYL